MIINTLYTYDANDNMIKEVVDVKEMFANINVNILGMIIGTDFYLVNMAGLA